MGPSNAEQQPPPLLISAGYQQMWSTRVISQGTLPTSHRNDRRNQAQYTNAVYTTLCAAPSVR